MGKVFASLFALCAFTTTADAQLEFHGYPCTQDCSGHIAGYEWAARNGVSDPYACGGNSNSFIEGCQAWAEEQEDSYGYGESEVADDYDGDGYADEPGDW